MNTDRAGDSSLCYLYFTHPLPPYTPVSVEGNSPPAHHTTEDIPWDEHLEDDLLKSLISRAKLFEDQIRYAIKMTNGTQPAS